MISKNAEANLGISSSGLAHLAGKLPVSRLAARSQRLVGFAQLRGRHRPQLPGAAFRGERAEKLAIDHEALAAELEDAWEVLAEAIQTVLRKQGYADAYEQLKALTRGQRVTQGDLREFITRLDIPKDDKTRLLGADAGSYLGYAEELALDAVGNK